MNKHPKYSIVIPTYNGVQYLPTCIETIISQDYKDYELIVSDDHSTDGTREFLETLEHPNITVIYPAESLSMTEHWEWALSHASGEWQIFVGQDDGLQAYFFQLADRLTIEAKEKGLRTIMSSRAYFFWKGCEYVYGDVAVSYTATNKTKVHNFKYEALKALLGLQTYFELPQMYTTALFHKDLLDEARSKQDGKVFSCHPQDANLAAIACSLETEYLKSYIPLGWVGSSPKSAGMAIFSDVDKADKNDQEGIRILKLQYQQKVKNSNLRYHELAGSFSFGNSALYFWQALLMTSCLRIERLNSFLISRSFKTIFFSSILSKSNNLLEFKKILLLNSCNYLVIRSGSFAVYIIKILWIVPSLLYRVVRKIYMILGKSRIVYMNTWSGNDHIDMAVASRDMQSKIQNRDWLTK